MGIVLVAKLNNQAYFYDSDDPLTPLGFDEFIGAGGKVLADLAKFMTTKRQLLEGITSAGSGVIVSASERAAFHGHSNLAILNQLTSPTSAQINYVPTATAAGVVQWLQQTATDPNNKGVFTNLAALKAAIPTAVAGNYAILTNSGGPASFGVWDPDAGPADWIDTGTGAPVLSVLGLTGTVTFDSDDIAEGSTNLWLTVAERADIALIAGHTTSIGSNTTLATHSNRAQLDLITAANSGAIITVAERAKIANYRETHSNLAALKASIPTGNAGDYAIVLNGTGANANLAIWDSDNTSPDWIELSAGASGVTTVNGQSGTVVLDADDISETATRVWVTPAQRTDIGTTKTTASGNATAIGKLTGQDTLTFSTALAWNAATKGLNVTCTLTGNTQPALLTGVNAGDRAKITFIQDSNGRRHVNWANFVGRADVAKEAGAKTDVDIYIESASVQRVSIAGTDPSTGGRMITYPSSTFDSIGGGATNVWDRVEGGTPVWTWDEVRKYEFCQYSDLQYSGPTFSQAQKDKLANVVANAPKTKVLATIRQDEWWFWNEAGIQFSAREWGVITSKPTFAMGLTPNDTAWATTQATVEGAGYGRDSEFDSLTASGTLLSFPNEIGLSQSPKEWWCRNNIMDVSNESWLDLLTDNIVAQRELEPSVAGFNIIFQKLQTYSPAFTPSNQFHEWVEGTANSGWILSSDSNGSVTPSWLFRDTYDTRDNNTMIDMFDAAIKIVEMLRHKDPGAILVFSPYNLTVDLWRNATYLSNFRSTYITKYGGTNDDADAYFERETSRAAAICEASGGGIELDADDDVADFSADWLSRLRSMGKAWILRSQKPQDISTLAQQ